MWGFAKRYYGKMNEAEWKVVEDRWMERNAKYLGDASPERGKPSHARKEWTPRKVAAAYCDRRGWDEETLYAVVDREMDWDYFEVQHDDERDE